jgi:hypothetical protein
VTQRNNDKCQRKKINIDPENLKDLREYSEIFQEEYLVAIAIYFMDLREIGQDDVDWIDLAQDRDQWRALVNTVMNLRVP